MKPNEVQRTCGRPKKSDWFSARIVTFKPASAAKSIVSSAETSNIRRPAGTGPWRSDRAKAPPSRSKPATVRMACRRWCWSRCIQTAVSNTTSKNSPRRVTRDRSGRRSSTHSILWGRVQGGRRRAEFARWLHCDDTMAHRSQRRGIAASPRSDVESPARPPGYQMQHRPMHIREADALVLLHEGVRMLGVARGGVIHGRFLHSAPPAGSPTRFSGRAVRGQGLQRVLLQRKDVLGHHPVGPLARSGFGVELRIGHPDQ